jgi:2-haloacid dehalogenase
MFMSEIKNVIFDFGGVLIEWSPYLLYRKVLPNDTEIERFLQEVHFYEWNYSFDQGYPFEMGIAEMCRRFPERADLIHILSERWLETLGVTYEANIAMIKELKGRGVPVFGLSNWGAETFERTRQKFPFFDLFDDRVISGEVKIAKPDPRIFNLLIERNHLDPQECLFIDDNEDNCRTARSLGITPVLYQNSKQVRGELVERGLLQ